MQLAADAVQASARSTPHPPLRTKWTRRVPHPELPGHVSSRGAGTTSGEAAPPAAQPRPRKGCLAGAGGQVWSKGVKRLLRPCGQTFGAPRGPCCACSPTSTSARPLRVPRRAGASRAGSGRAPRRRSTSTTPRPPWTARASRGDTCAPRARLPWSHWSRCARAGTNGSKGLSPYAPVYQRGPGRAARGRGGARDQQSVLRCCFEACSRKITCARPH